MATSKGRKGSDGTPGTGKTVTAIQHDDAKRKNIPTAEYQSVLEKQKLAPVEVVPDEEHHKPRELAHRYSYSSGIAQVRSNDWPIS